MASLFNNRLPQLVEETQKDLEASGITAGILGHAGDGNFHAGLSVSKENFAEVDAAAGRVCGDALSTSPTLSTNASYKSIVGGEGNCFRWHVYRCKYSASRCAQL